MSDAGARIILHALRLLLLPCAIAPETAGPLSQENRAACVAVAGHLSSYQNHHRSKHQLKMLAVLP